MPSSKNKSKGSKDAKGSKKGKGSPKNGSNKNEPIEEEELIVPVPEGIMHRRLRYLLQSTLKTDVDFIVGPDGNTTTIKAHKCMLAAESPSFEKLFDQCESWKEELLRTRDMEAQAERENDALVEAELAREAANRQGSQKKSPGNSSSKDKKGSKSPKKSNSPKNDKSPKSKESKDKKSKDSRGSKKGSNKSPKSKAGAAQPQEFINFHIDEVIGEDTIRVQDVHPFGFFRLLRYIYYDEMVFTGVIGTIRTLYAARKYCFYDLARACVNYLENNVCIEHIFRLLQAAVDFHEDRLKSLCMRLIINDTFEVISLEGFKDIKKELVVMILEQDVLNAREVEIFDRVMHWAENECDRLQITVTAMNQRIALGNHHLALIRFPTILAHEFATHVVESGVLRTEEVIPILQYYITGRKPKLPYSTKVRRRPCLDIGPLDNASVAFSDQTDLTFLGHAGNLRRASSFRDILIPINVMPPIPIGLVKERQRTGSPPARFHVSDIEFDEIEENMRHLKHLFCERNHFEYTKQYMSVMRSHYR